MLGQMKIGFPLIKGEGEGDGVMHLAISPLHPARGGQALALSGSSLTASPASATSADIHGAAWSRHCDVLPPNASISSLGSRHRHRHQQQLAAGCSQPPAARNVPRYFGTK